MKKFEEKYTLMTSYAHIIFDVIYTVTWWYYA